MPSVPPPTTADPLAGHERRQQAASAHARGGLEQRGGAQVGVVGQHVQQPRRQQ